MKPLDKCLFLLASRLPDVGRALRAYGAFAALAVLASVAGFGCYTILRHPVPVTEEGSFGSTFEERTCADCHADADLEHMSGMAGWYRSYPPSWADWYDRPWWWDDYWPYVPPPPFGPGPGHDPNDPGERSEQRSGRNLWTRPPGGGPGWLPSQGSPGDVKSGEHPDSSGSAGDPWPGTGGQGTGSGKGGNDGNKKDDKDKSKEKSDQQRRLWRR